MKDEKESIERIIGCSLAHFPWQPAVQTERVKMAEYAAEKETLVMATNAEFPPYEYREGEEIVGIDIDIANAIGE